MPLIPRRLRARRTRAARPDDTQPLTDVGRTYPGSALRANFPPATWSPVRRVFDETGDAVIPVDNQLIEALGRYEYEREGLATPWSELTDGVRTGYVDAACETVEFMKGASL